MKERLDVLLVKQGHAGSREKAKAIIMSGNVFINGQREDIIEFEKQALKEIYGIDEAERKRILMTLSPAAWMTMTDLSEELGYKFSVILRVFATMEDMIETKGTAVKLYRRKSDV